MSRSRKKVGGFVDRNPYMKKYANRRVRRLSAEQVEHEFGGGKSARVRRYTCPWDICDFKDVYFSVGEVEAMFIRHPHIRRYYKVHNFWNK